MCDLFAADDGDFPLDFPLSYAEIKQRQKDDAKIKALLKKPNLVHLMDFRFGDSTFKLVTTAGKILLPASFQLKASQWYHESLLHPGLTRMELTMGQHYTWSGMWCTIEQVCRCCISCQLNKIKLTQMGHLPKKTAEKIPWERVCIDLIGPYTVGSPKKSDKLTLHCMTMIDPVTRWFKIAEIPAKSADVVANTFEIMWLVRYPAEVIMDCGCSNNRR